MTLVTAVTTDHEDPAPGARPAGAGLARGVASVRGQRGNEDQGVCNTAFIRLERSSVSVYVNVVEKYAVLIIWLAL